jgi:biopolymer transport protein ExbD
MLHLANQGEYQMVPTISVILLGLLLFASTTAAVAQGAPMEVSLKHSEVSAKAESVDHSIDAISLRCDKCDGLVKKEINGAKQEAAGLKRLLDQLRDITNAKFVAVAKACK